ncbi:MAG: HAD-IC family P-type ATPase [Daejeonella sp.]|uniref:cation-translocating P-type ATPase n=1 Tax=Daejeonella sp. TaxID=2805397 RepID=UPI003C776417
MNIIFHQLSSEETLSQLNATSNGLTKEEVLKRQSEHGRNTIPQPKSKTLIRIFLSQFLNPLIYVLMAAALISLFTGDMRDAMFILAIIVFNSILGTYQEWRAENSAKALRDLVKVITRVKRDGHIYAIDSEELVPGDIVLLESGFKVPADLRLIDANNLWVEEALLTGESVAINKTVEPLKGGTELSIGDRLNMAFAATTVQKGRGTGIVTDTAKDTQIGQIADSLKMTEPEKPPLVKRMEGFSKKVSIIVLVVCLILGLIGFYKGTPLNEIFFLMVAVGVSAIPEGLPIGLTVALAIGTRRMARRNVIVRKLPAVEGLGSCTLIASDKTGTLTVDQQSIKKLYLPGNRQYQVSGQGYNGEGTITTEDGKGAELDDTFQDFMMAGIMANEGILRKTNKGWEHSGDAVDVAFRALCYKSGKEPVFFNSQAEIVEIHPYESESKFSAVFYKHHNKLKYALKGAMEVVIEKIPAALRSEITAVSEQMAAEGYRVMALAGGTVETADINNLPELKLLGLVGMIDPLRPEAQDAVKLCQQAGIEVFMVTGDHPATALALAKELGIAANQDEIITGAELQEMKGLAKGEFALRLKDKKVFARVAPLQKRDIIEAMKSLGHFVAVTGDGANDAPALKSAHIGIAMGAGTDLAKEASSIIIADNNFASIAAGVEEGRYTFDNLRKIIYLLISTGAAELIVIGLAIILSIPLPFLAVQLLWLNLVTNGIQDIALAFEKGDATAMTKPPRNPNESIFDKLMNTQIIVSAFFIAGILFTLWWHLIYNLNYNEGHARSVVMMLMVLMQNFHVLNCRSETKSLFKMPLKNNYVLLAGMLLAQGVHILATYSPLGATLHLEPITLSEWLKLLPTAAIILLVMEIFKWLWNINRKQS